jgi:HK97 family phage portal protein
MCLHLGFYGSAYNLKVPGAAGSVTELHPLHPSGMEVRQEDDHSLTYLYRKPGTGQQVVYRDDQIMHVRWLSFDGVNGAVPVDLGKDAISLARSLEQYAATFYRNNAQPGVVLHTDQALPREVREQLREQWNNRHRGPSRAGEVAVLSNGLKVDTVSATNQESQLAELWMQALLAVCRIWKMPPHMVQELGRATWGNLASEMVSFEKFTIQPWLRRIEGAIERDILGDDDDGPAVHDVRIEWRARLRVEHDRPRLTHDGHVARIKAWMVYGTNLPNTLPNPEQTYRAIQALKVCIYNKSQVIQTVSGCKLQCPTAFDLVELTVS